MSEMTISINGESLTFPIGINLKELIEKQFKETTHLATAKNAAIIPQSRWEEETLMDGDVLEILSAQAGG